MAHPLRLRILSLLTSSAMSAADVARELGLTHANASYHLRRLLEAGRIEEAGEERIRGGVAKLYRYPHERDFRAVAKKRTRRADSSDDLLPLARAFGSELERRLLSPGVAWVNNSDLDGWVSPEAWEQARALLVEASQLLHDANRPPRTEGTVHVSFTTWSFELGSTPGGGDA
jgi:DNA-binding transcriptional ArsR family regulator